VFLSALVEMGNKLSETVLQLFQVRKGRREGKEVSKGGKEGGKGGLLLLLLLLLSVITSIELPTY
jgi:hypothetical protein